MYSVLVGEALHIGIDCVPNSSRPSMMLTLIESESLWVNTALPDIILLYIRMSADSHLNLSVCQFSSDMVADILSYLGILLYHLKAFLLTASISLISLSVWGTTLL